MRKRLRKAQSLFVALDKDSCIDEHPVVSREITNGMHISSCNMVL